MKLISLLRVKNIKEAIAFYTGILDFELKYPKVTDASESAIESITDIL